MSAVPGKRTVMASCTACLSRLSKANIQWGFTCFCFNTFFTCSGQKTQMGGNTWVKVPLTQIVPSATRNAFCCEPEWPTASWKLKSTTCRLFRGTLAETSFFWSAKRLLVSCLLSGERMLFRMQLISSVILSAVRHDPSPIYKEKKNIYVHKALNSFFCI